MCVRNAPEVNLKRRAGRFGERPGMTNGVEAGMRPFRNAGNGHPGWRSVGVRRGHTADSVSHPVGGGSECAQAYQGGSIRRCDAVSSRSHP